MSTLATQTEEKEVGNQTDSKGEQEAEETDRAKAQKPKAAKKAFLARARALHAVQWKSSPHPLDYCAAAAQQYPQGAVGFVLRDLVAIDKDSPPGLRSSLAAMLQQGGEDAQGEGVARAYAVRKELCNFKKVCLHLFQRAQRMEKDFTRLVTYNYLAPERLPSGQYAHTVEPQPEGYAELNKALQRCKACKAALHDARDVTKAICMLPRDPHTLRPAKLRGLPRSMLAAKQLLQAMRLVAKVTTQLGGEGQATGRGGGGGKGDVSTTLMHCVFNPPAEQRSEVGEESGKTKEAKDLQGKEGKNQDEQDEGGHGNDHEPVMLGGLRSVLQRVAAVVAANGGAEFLTEFVEASLLARGAAKALAMRRQLQVLVGAYESLDAAFSEGLQALERAKQLVERRLAEAEEAEREVKDKEGEGEGAGGGSRVSRLCAVATQLESKAVFLTTFRVCTAAFAHWLSVMHGSGGGAQAGERGERGGGEEGGRVEGGEGGGIGRWFVAGDQGAGGAALFLPKAFQSSQGAPLVLRQVGQVLQKYQRRFQADVVSEGFPPPPNSRRCRVLFGIEGKNPCWKCGRSFGAMWAARGVCCLCEEEERREGKCPFVRGKRRDLRCPINSFCVHARRCVICDGHSCRECRLLRGDGADVRMWGEGMPNVFVDFDRTFASTKNGANPLVGGGSGGHRIDEDLLALAAGHANFHVVTRNSHRTEIETFLRRHGLRQFTVHCVPKGTSKAVRVLEATNLVAPLASHFPAPPHPPAIPAAAAAADDDDDDDDDDVAAASLASSAFIGAPSILFVDDTLREVCDVRLRSDPRVLRVLFVRGL